MKRHPHSPHPLSAVWSVNVRASVHVFTILNQFESILSVVSGTKHIEADYCKIYSNPNGS